MKKIFKIVSINLFFTVFLFGLFLLIPPITYLFYQLLISDNNTFIISDDRSKLDIYNEYEWADEAPPYYRSFGSIYVYAFNSIKKIK